jgi:hypothetical protein
MNEPWVRSLPRKDLGLQAALSGLGVVGAVVMELAWFTPWFRYFNLSGKNMGEPRVLAWFALAAVLAALAGRGLRAGRTSRLLRSASLLVLLAIETVVLLLVFHPTYPGLSLRDFLSAIAASMGSVLQVIPAELVIILSALFVFRQGIVAAERDVLAPERLHFRFRLGIVILAAFGLVFREVEGRLMLEALPVYFFAGLAALAASRIDRAPMHARDGEGLGRFAWLAVMLGIISITIGLGLGLSRILQSRLAAEVVGALASVFLEALRVIVILISPAIQALTAFLGWLITLAARALGGSQGLAAMLGGMQSLGQAVSLSEGGPPSWIQVHAREIAAVGTGLLVGLLALAAIRGGRRKSSGAQDKSVEEIEMIPRGEGARTEDRGALTGGRRRGRVPMEALEQMLAASSVRRIYGRLLRMAHAHGRSRSPAETPLEFLDALRGLFPNHQDEVEVITRAYIEVGYGGRSDEDAGIDEVRRAWAAMQPSPGPRVRPPGAAE